MFRRDSALNFADTNLIYTIKHAIEKSCAFYRWGCPIWNAASFNLPQFDSEMWGRKVMGFVIWPFTVHEKSSLLAKARNSEAADLDILWHLFISSPETHSCLWKVKHSCSSLCCALAKWVPSDNARAEFDFFADPGVDHAVIQFSINRVCSGRLEQPTHCRFAEFVFV